MHTLLTDAAADVRYALRTWLRQPGFVLIAVLSLGCGIGLNTAVFSIINTIFLQGIRGVPAPDRIVTVGARVSYTTVRTVRDAASGLGDVAAWQPIGVDIKAGDAFRRGAAPVVSGNYFVTLGVVPARGRFFTSSIARVPEPSAEVVLDYEFWTDVFGSRPDVIGQTVLINRVPATIVGVAPRSFHGFGPERPPLWIPMGMLPAIRRAAVTWDSPAESGWRIVGRLADGVSAGQLNAELRTLASRMPEVFTSGPLVASTTGQESWDGPVSPEKRIEFLLVVVVPLVVVALILWIGCSNVANLLLSRAAVRRKEIAIRLANGASRWRLIRLLLTEGLILAIAGGAAGILLAEWALEFIWLTLPEAPRLAIELDTRVLLYTGAVCVLATALFGLVPALHATRIDVAPLLKSDAPAISEDVKRGVRMRRFFLITQFASSMALVVVAGTFVRTIVTTHLGAQAAAMDRMAIASLEATLPQGPARAAYWQSVRESLGRLPNVTAVSLMPAGQTERVPLAPEGTAPLAAQPQVEVQWIDGGFMAISGATVSAGRFDAGAPQGGPVESVAVNERAARQFWGTIGVLDRRFSLATGTIFQIAAVVRDENTSPRVYRTLRDEDMTSANAVVLGTTAATQLVAPVRAALTSLATDASFVRVATMREASTGSLTRITRLALVIAGLVLALATVGLYGSIAFVTSQRTREIAIRMAIGAPRAAVLGLVAREGVLVVAAGSAIGLALIGVAFQFMSGMIFATWTLDPLTIAGVLALFTLSTLGACYFPGRRAARLDPMRVLRAD